MQRRLGSPIRVLCNKHTKHGYDKYKILRWLGLTGYGKISSVSEASVSHLC